MNRPNPMIKPSLANMPENTITERIIKCAIEVYRRLGPGLLEGVYEEALTIECEFDGLDVKRQLKLPIH